MNEFIKREQIIIIIKKRGGGVCFVGCCWLFVLLVVVGCWGWHTVQRPQAEREKRKGLVGITILISVFIILIRLVRG